jgi:hypothetical protein
MSPEICYRFEHRRQSHEQINAAAKPPTRAALPRITRLMVRYPTRLGLLARATEPSGLNSNQPRSSGYRLQFTRRSVPGD